MTTNRKIGLVAVAWMMSLASAGAVGDNETPDALNVHLNNNAVQTTRLNDLRRITFSGNNLVLLMQNANQTSYALNDVRKITFGKASSNGITPVAPDLDILVYVTPQGEVVVETPYAVRSLTLFDITGKKWQTSAESRLNINALTSGVYILQINTAQGSVTKKIIKK